MSTNPPQRIPAPPLEPNLGWLNTDRPVDLLELRGKVVLLDFWTYCCINCHHVLPDLAWLERKYPNELVVIGDAGDALHLEGFDPDGGGPADPYTWQLAASGKHLDGSTGGGDNSLFPPPQSARSRQRSEAAGTSPGRRVRARLIAG